LSVTDTQEAAFKRAVALHEAGKFGDAATLYRDILKVDPNNVMVIHLLALVAMQFDNAAMVLALAEQGLRVEPRMAVLHQDRATALRRLGHKEDALSAINQALALQPDEADFYDTLAAIQRDLRHYDQAVQSLKRAIQLDMQNPKYYNNLAICLGRMGANEEALFYIDQYIKMKPGEATGYNNKANVLKACRRYREAIENYDRALAINPDIFMGKANKGIGYLVLGEYREGWALFEERKPGNQPPEGARFDPARRWKGESDQTASLVIYHEQGLGDTVQFCRYIELIRPRIGQLMLQVQAPLKSFLQANWPDIPMFTFEDALPEYTYQCPLMSLPHVFETTTTSIPLAQGYLKADADKIAAWKNRLPLDGKRKVGLVWAGNPDHMNDHIRSIPLSLFEPLWGAANVHYVSLQKGKGALEQMASLPGGISFTHVGEELNDFTDTAALIMNLDLLLTVDTSVLHVAGALGRPAWAMLQYDPDWRWMLERTDTPWYASVRLFRQASYGNWADVVAKAAAALAAK
jgi:tetratricopeptide (TPR) repeat protein